MKNNFPSQTFNANFEPREQLSVQVRTIRKGLNLTQDELAKKAGVPRTTICQIENQKYGNPGLDLIAKIADGINAVITITFFPHSSNNDDNDNDNDDSGEVKIRIYRK